MKISFLFYVVSFFLFVSCKQKNRTADYPVVNIDSLKPVSQIVLNIDTAVYIKETKAFLQQVVINEIGFKKNKSVISDATETGIILNPKAKYFLYDSVNFNQTDYDTIKSLMKNPVISKWTTNFFAAKKIISEDTIQLIFQDRNKGWNYFYDKYGYGYYHFMEPVFMKNYTYCIFYKHLGCGYLCGESTISLYKKINGKWKLIKTYSHSIS